LFTCGLFKFCPGSTDLRWSKVRRWCEMKQKEEVVTSMRSDPKIFFWRHWEAIKENKPSATIVWAEFWSRVSWK
jgi:hypothetical protein